MPRCNASRILLPPRAPPRLAHRKFPYFLRAVMPVTLEGAPSKLCLGGGFFLYTHKTSALRDDQKPVQAELGRGNLKAQERQHLSWPSYGRILLRVGSNFSTAHIQPADRPRGGHAMRALCSCWLWCLPLVFATVPLHAEDHDEKPPSPPHAIADGTTFLIRLEDKLDVSR